MYWFFSPKALLASVIAVIMTVCLLTGSLIAVIFDRAMDESFYEEQFEQCGVGQVTGMSDDDLMAAITTLLDYISGERDDIVVTAAVHGAEREVFNQRETDHMVDVKNLYSGARAVCIACWCAFAVLLLVLWFGRLRYWHTVIRTFLVTAVVYVLAVVGVCVWGAFNFDVFWPAFHHLFFTNDLWLLDPTTDIMIQMLPGNLFLALVVRIVITYAVVLLVIFGVLILARVIMNIGWIARVSARAAKE